MAKEPDVIETMIDRLKLKFKPYDGEELRTGDIVETKDGKRHLVGDVNRNLGVCDDCTIFNRPDIVSLARLRRR